MRVARKEPITTPVIQKLRKEFLVLVGNVKRIKNLTMAAVWRKGLLRWKEYVKDLFGQIRDQIKGLIRWDSQWDERDRKVDNNWANHYLNKQSTLWDFIWGLADGDPVPVPKKILQGKFSDYYTDEEFIEQEFNKWHSTLLKWDRMIRRRARAAWKWLDEFSAWTMGPRGGEEAVEWQIVEKENLTLEGFQIRLIGYEGEDLDRRGLEHVKQGLKHYRQRAGKVFPLLIEKQIPLEFHFSGAPSRDLAGRYLVSHIAMYQMYMTKPPSMAKTLAHEMGHHLFLTVLNSKQRTFWTNAVEGDFGDLDLREVMGRLKPGESLWDFEDRIKLSDPITYLKLKTVYEQPRYRDMGLWSFEDLKDAMDSGRLESVIRVPKTPITGYAGKNPEEAFCETIGLLVAYGPAAVLPQAKHWLSVLFPRMRMAARLKTTGPKTTGPKTTGPTLQNLKSKLVRLAYANPGKVRNAILPILVKSAGDTVPRDVTAFIRQVEEAFRRYFKTGYFQGGADPWGNSIDFTFALLPKGKQSGKILENDHTLMRFTLFGSWTPDGINPKVRVERTQGSVLAGPNFTYREKIPWRNGAAAPSKIASKFDKYFRTLRAMVDAREDLPPIL